MKNGGQFSSLRQLIPAVCLIFSFILCASNESKSLFYVIKYIRVLNELKITSILDKITSYKSDCTQHVNRMPRSRLPNLLTKYVPRCIRNQGRPLKRLLDE
jgi:hypothetical protein